MRLSRKEDSFSTESGLAFLIVFLPVIYMLAAIVLVLIISKNGTYPSGRDTLYHLYCGDYLYQSIADGNFSFRWNPMWYNGVELFRYKAPAAASVLAICEALANGNLLNGYLIYVGLLFFSSSLVWLSIGKRVGRPWLGAFLGVIWFFAPYNLYTLFGEGNLAKSLCRVLLPIVIFGLHDYMTNRKWKSLLIFAISYVGILFCHLGTGIVLLLAIFIMLFIIRINNQSRVGQVDVVMVLVLSFLVIGTWVFPMIMGENFSLPEVGNIRNYVQSFWTSINPFARVQAYEVTSYFGLSIFLIAMIGILAASRKEQSGFFEGIILLILTTQSMYYVESLIPGINRIELLQLIPIGICAVLFSFLAWTRLRRPVALFFCIILLADVMPSLPLLYGENDGKLVEERFADLQIQSLVKEAQKITKQRMIILDGGNEDATLPFLVSGWGDGVQTSSGYEWKTANISPNMVNINRAIEENNFLYVFDRCMELGNDTVLLKLDQVDKHVVDMEEVDSWARKRGYFMRRANNNYRLYHMETPKQWGVLSDFKGIGIGTMSSTISRQFPIVEDAETTNLNDFTYEELSKYNLIYLAGFTYDDREAAEEMILKLSENGTHIVIAADGIPEDRATSGKQFLGVRCNAISFTNGFPELDTVDGIIYADLFPPEAAEWNTVYLDGLDEVWGSVVENDLRLPFYGTVKNENIVMIGINLIYHYSLTRDATVGKLLAKAMDLQGDEMPERKIVPLEITYQPEEIVIHSDYDNVNTTLAYHEIFESQKEIQNVNNLLVVNTGDTEIKLQNPYLVKGIVLTVIGILLMSILLIHIYMVIRREEIERANMVEEDEAERAERERLEAEREAALRKEYTDS